MQRQTRRSTQRAASAAPSTRRGRGRLLLAGAAAGSLVVVPAAGAAETRWLSAPYAAGLTHPTYADDPAPSPGARSTSRASGPRLSGDGRTAVFGVAQSSPFYVQGAGRSEHTLRYDTATEERTVVSRFDDGTLARDLPDAPLTPRDATISDDGTAIGLSSAGLVENDDYTTATRIVVGGRNTIPDRKAAAQLLTVDNDGQQLDPYGNSYQEVDGGGGLVRGGDGDRYALFYTDANAFLIPQVDAPEGSAFAWPSYLDDVSTLLIRDTRTNRTRLPVLGTDGGVVPGLGVAARSADGRYVVLTSTADTLVAGESGGSNVLVDLEAAGGPSVTPLRLGTTGSTTGITSPRLSADGRYLVFGSVRTDLAAGTTASVSQVYRHDLRTGTTTLLSATAAGVPGNGQSGARAVSADGRWIVGTTRGTNLVTTTVAQLTTAVLWDAERPGVAERVALTPSGDDPTSVYSSGSYSGAGSTASDVSDDGRFVAFASNGDGLTPDLYVRETAAEYEAFLRDRATKPASARTDAASDVARTTAAVAGHVAVPGPEDTAFQRATVRVEYGTSPAYGTTSQASATVEGDASDDVRIALTGLKPSTTYHYRVTAENAAGRTTGEDRTFTTAAAPSDGPSGGGGADSGSGGGSGSGSGAGSAARTVTKRFVVSASASRAALRVAVVRRRGLRIRLGLDAPGTARVRATISASAARRLGLTVPKGASRVRIGSATVSAARAGKRTVVVKLTTRARQRLARVRGRLSVRVEVTATGSTRKATTYRKTVVVRR